MEPVLFRNPANGQTIDVFATLYPVVQTGNIYVNSNPAGASAILDNGYAQLTTPGTFSSVSTGWHNVQVSKRVSGLFDRY